MCLLRDYKIEEVIMQVADSVMDGEMTIKILEGWFFDYLDLITRAGLFKDIDVKLKHISKLLLKE